jgi:large subunit ribosomal protein L9
MKIILIKPVTGLGLPGTVKEVADGYARNYLLPRGLADVATPSKLKKLEEAKVAKEQAMSEKREELVGAIDKLGGIEIKFKKKANKTGKLFAAVGEKAIAEELSKKLKIKVNEEMISTDQPIKTVGEHSVQFVFDDNLQGEFKVIVEEE